MSRLAVLILAPILVLALGAEAALAGAVVPVRAIRGQSLIGPEDVELADLDAPGAIADPAAVVGREARVTLYPGRPILKGQVGAPALVERNQIVRMTFASGPLSISAEGRVLDRGGEGETVRVMNLSSRQVVSGEVTPDGSIEVVR
jgi:flagellar basal body P-ring formation protein FlgA